MITSDKKRGIYSNIIRSKWCKRNEPAQTISKAELHQKKGVVYVEQEPDEEFRCLLSVTVY